MINRRNFLSTSALAATATWAQGYGSKRDKQSLKKGWAGGAANMHELFGVHWSYNWGLNGGAENFVPMFKGKAQMGGGPLNRLKNMESLPYLLGYNEPERAKQGNLTLEEALEYWPKLQEVAEEKGTLLGSPAPSSDKGGLEWLDSFMEQAKRRKLKVDFIAIHYYGGTNPDTFERFIKNIAKEYRLPIWLTEFNGWSGTREEHEDFLKPALRFLERERSVERYAYFNPGKGKPHSLIDADGSINSLGELYRDAGT